MQIIGVRPRLTEAEVLRMDSAIYVLTSPPGESEVWERLMNVIKDSDLTSLADGFALTVPTRLLQNRRGRGLGDGKNEETNDETSRSLRTLLNRRVTMMALNN